MANIVDIIEEYIKARLNQSNGGIIVFRRNELAEKFQCVPSQINYVLSTRFSVNRGYIIETRRGGGGFIRIIKVNLDKTEDLIDLIYEKVGDQVSLDEAVEIIRYLYDEEIITKREAHIMENAIQVAISQDDQNGGKKRAIILKAMLMVLLRHPK